MTEQLKPGNHIEKGHPMTTLMPSERKMIEKLREAKLITQDSNYNIFYNTFAEEIHNKETNAVGLNFMWNSAGKEIMLGLTPKAQAKTAKSLNQQFDKAIKVLVPSSEVAEEAIKIREDIPHLKSII
jgi:hypothetical protein